MHPQLIPSCSDDPQPFTPLQTIFAAANCVFGVVGNALTLVILSRRRLRTARTTEEDPSVRSAHVDMQALAASNMLLCFLLLPHGFMPTDCLRHKQRWSFHIVYWLYSNAATNTLILAGTWLTVTMAVVRYLAIAFPFRVRFLIGRTGSKMKVVAVFAASCLMNVPRLFEHQIETIRCTVSLRPTWFNQTELDYAGSNWTIQATLSSGSDGVNDMSRTGMDVGEMEIYMQKAGPLESLADYRIMNIYVWMYFVIGICLPLVLLAIGNFGLVRTLRQSTRLRQQFLARSAHIDANERVTIVLVTVVVAYLVLVAPAEILQFVDRQLDIASKPDLLASVVQVTNILQTVSKLELWYCETDGLWFIYLFYSFIRFLLQAKTLRK